MKYEIAMVARCWPLTLLALLPACRTAAKAPVAAVASRHAAPTAPPVVQAQIVAARVEGIVVVANGGRAEPLGQGGVVAIGTTVRTGSDSSVVLLFSNGASVRLGADTELIVEQFLQDPFAATTDLTALAEEPSASRTHLRLVRGELVGQIKRLRFAQGSEFGIATPVGVMSAPLDRAGAFQAVGEGELVRTTRQISVGSLEAIQAARAQDAKPPYSGGGTFRISWRPLAGGSAASFSLASAVGRVVFSAPDGSRRVVVPEGNELSMTVEVTRKG